MQDYSDPDRALDPMALPDLEIWEAPIVNIVCSCGEVNECPQSEFYSCLECGAEILDTVPTTKLMWWYWYCFPGCLPDSDVNGPFTTYDDAMNDVHQA